MKRIFFFFFYVFSCTFSSYSTSREGKRNYLIESARLGKVLSIIRLFNAYPYDDHESIKVALLEACQHDQIECASVLLEKYLRISSERDNGLLLEDPVFPRRFASRLLKKACETQNILTATYIAKFCNVEHELSGYLGDMKALSTLLTVCQSQLQSQLVVFIGQALKGEELDLGLFRILVAHLSDTFYLVDLLLAASRENNLAAIKVFLDDGRCNDLALRVTIARNNLALAEMIIQHPKTDLDFSSFTEALTKNLEIAKTIFEDPKFDKNTLVLRVVKERPVGCLVDLYRKVSFEKAEAIRNFQTEFLPDYTSKFSINFDYSEVIKTALNNQCQDEMGEQEKTLMQFLFDSHKFLLGTDISMGVNCFVYLKVANSFYSLLEETSNILDSKLKSYIQMPFPILQTVEVLKEKSNSIFNFLMEVSRSIKILLSKVGSHERENLIAAFAEIVRKLPVGKNITVPLLYENHVALATFSKTAENFGTYRVFNSGDGASSANKGRIPAWEEFRNVPCSKFVEIFDLVTRNTSAESFRKLAYPEEEYEHVYSLQTVVPQGTGSCAGTSIRQFLLVTMGRSHYMVFKTISTLFILGQIYSSLGSARGKIEIRKPLKYSFTPVLLPAYVYIKQTKVLENALIKQLNRKDDPIDDDIKALCLGFIQQHLDRYNF